MEFNRDTKLKEIMKTPSGHDIISKLLYVSGLGESIIEKTPLGNIKISALSKLSLGKLNDKSIDAIINLLNSLGDGEKDDDKCEVKEEWWKEAVFYQIYPKSFYDSNNDGIGDIKGITTKLDYIKSLGVDAIWCSPFYDSPNADNGYDVRDYKKIMKEFGSMEDVEELFKEAHKRGIKVIIDLVMNHTSDEHEWFQKALKGDEKYSNYYFWKDKPNNWASSFGGSAWKYFDEKKKYALHLFDEKQIDLNWDNPEVRQEMCDIANYWLEKGADGFRLDVVSLISKAQGLPDGDPLIGSLISLNGAEHYFYGPHLDEYLREFNEKSLSLHNAYTVGECPGVGLKMSRMLTGDDRHELSQLFSFEHLENPGKRRMDIYEFDLRTIIPEIVRWQTKYSNHCWPTIFFNNHDKPRMSSKIDHSNKHSDIIGKMLVTIQMTLRGTPYIYQGDEIGMIDYPFKSLDEYRDVESFGFYKEYKEKGESERKVMKRLLYGSRDHARIPMQWTDEENAGFSKTKPWINVHPEYKTTNVKVEEENTNSVLTYYRKMIKLRKENKALVYGEFEQLKTNRNIFAYKRTYNDKEYMVIVNLVGKKQQYPFNVDYRLVCSNYNTYSNYLRPYESIAFEVK